MKPLGRKTVRFPNKTKEWFGKGIKMWWEVIVLPNKNRDKQTSKKEIEREINDTERAL